MSKIGTKDIKPQGGQGQSKTLEPGNHQLKINGVSLDELSFKKGSFNLTLHMEGPDLGPTFNGFWLNKDNEALGKHKGLVGRIRATEWAFADGETKSKVPVSRDSEILKFMKTLCTALGTVKWLDDQDEKHDTVESLIIAFNSEQPFKDKYLNYCVGGKEYKDKKGYTKYDLFLPKFSKSGVPFEPVSAKPSKILKYNDEEHLKKAKVTEVSEFGNPTATEGTLSDETKKDFHL